MKNQEYNGWNNYQTWVTALWIDNDYGTYQYRCELVELVKQKHSTSSERENCLASVLKDWIEQQNPLAANADLFTDLLNSALSEIDEVQAGSVVKGRSILDWHEIAENFLAE